MGLTYKDLLHHIQFMSAEQQEQDVTVLDCEEGEYYPVQHIVLHCPEDDVLDKDHPFLTIKLRTEDLNEDSR